MVQTTAGAVAAMDPGVLARAVAGASTLVRGVSRLVGGTGVEAATYYPGGKVVGVVLAPDVVRVHCVVGRLPLVPVADTLLKMVGAVLTEAGDARPVQVVVEDVEASALASAFRPPVGARAPGVGGL